jgi:hypothetical protein
LALLPNSIYLFKPLLATNKRAEYVLMFRLAKVKKWILLYIQNIIIIYLMLFLLVIIPTRAIRGFKRVEISAGKTQKVTIELTPFSFEFYNSDQRKMMVTPGEYEIFYGTSSYTKDLKTLKVTVK